jgi:hypothetical protein
MTQPAMFEHLPVPILERLSALQNRGGDRALRGFAIWAASQVSNGHDSVSGLVAKSRSLLAMEEGNDFETAYRDIAGAMAATATIGLRNAPAAAHAQLAAFHTLASDALSAASGAAWHARMHYICRARGGFEQEERHEAMCEADALAMGDQIDQLDRMINALT